MNYIKKLPKLKRPLAEIPIRFDPYEDEDDWENRMDDQQKLLEQDYELGRRLEYYGKINI